MEKDFGMFFALYYLVLYYSFVIMCFYIWGLGFRKLFFDVTFSVTMIKLNSHCTFKILDFQIFFIKILFFSYKIKWSDIFNKFSQSIIVILKIIKAKLRYHNERN